MKKIMSVLARKSIETLILAAIAFAFDFLVAFLSSDDSIWIGESIEIVGAILFGPVVGFIASFINCALTDFLIYGSFDYVLTAFLEASAVTVISLIYKRVTKKNADRFGVREIAIFNFIQIFVNVAVLFLSTAPVYLLIVQWLDWSTEEMAVEMRYLAETAFSTCASVALIGTILLAIALTVRRRIREKGSLKAAIKSMFALTFLSRMYRFRAFQYTLSVFITIAFTMVDGIMSGHLLGQDALSAISLMIPLVSFVTFFSTFIVKGVSNRVVTVSGEGDSERAKKLFSCGLLASLAIGPLQTLVLFLVKDLYLGVYSASDAIMEFAGSYYDVYIFIPIFFTITEFLDEMVCSDGDVKLSVGGYVLSFAVDIAASILLVDIMGIGGLAVARMIGFLSFILILLIHFFKKKNTLKFRLWFSFKDLLLFVKYAMTDNLTPLCTAMTSAMLTKAILLILGPEYLIVNVIICAMLEIYESINGPSEGSAFLIESYTGEHNLKGIKTVFKEAMFATLLLGMAAALVLIVWPEAVTLLYGVEETPIHDELMKCIRFAALGVIPGCISGFLTDYYGNMGKPFWSSLLSFLRIALFPVLFCVTFCLTGGTVEIGRGLLLSQVTATLVFYGFVLTAHGLSSIPFLLDEGEFDKVDMLSFNFRQEEHALVLDWLSHQLEKSLRLDEERIKRVRDTILSLIEAIEERNKGKKVYGECVFSYVDEQPKIIVKDDGKLFKSGIQGEGLSYNIVLSHNYNVLPLTERPSPSVGSGII